MFKKNYIVMLALCICLIANACPVIAAEMIFVKSVYKDASISGTKREVIWSFEYEGSNVKVSKEGSESLLIIRRDNKNIVYDIEFKNDVSIRPFKASATSKNSRAQSNPIFLSDGHPAPFDWIDPDAKETGELVSYKNAGGMTFKTVIKKEIEFLRTDQAVDAGYLNDENIIFAEPDKRYILINISKDGKVILRQVWQEGDKIWLYESTDLRTSFRIR